MQSPVRIDMWVNKSKKSEKKESQGIMIKR